MSTAERVRDIIIKPKEEWLAIKGEATAIADLYKNYVAPLAAIPAVAGFIGAAVIGERMLGTSYRLGFGSALGQAVIGYVLTFVVVFLLAIVIDKLATSFAATPDQGAAHKVAVYSATPVWVAGVFYLIPDLAWIGLLAGLYAIYVLYLGLKTLMQAPEDKAVVYTAAVVVAYIVLALIVGAVLGATMGRHMMW
ncbi:MAG: Yip1 family protein [Pseudomonadota bacterium]